MTQSRFGDRIYAVALTAFALCMLCDGVASSKGAETKLVSRHTLFADADLSVAKLRPDGRHVAFVRLDGAERSLWLSPIDNVSAGTRIDDNVPGAALNCWWMADGARLIVQRAVGKDVHLYRFDVVSREWSNLTPKDGLQARFERLSLSRPQELLVAMNDRDPKVHDLCIVNVETGEQQRVFDATGFTKAYTDATFLPRVTERALRNGKIELLRQTTDGVWEVFRTLDQDDTNLQRAPGSGVQSVVGVDPSGKMVYIVDHAGRDKSALAVIEIATGEEKVAAEDPNADMRPTAIVDRLTGGVLGASAYFGEIHRYYLQPEIEAEIADLRKQLAGDVGLVEISLHDAAWLVAPLDGGPVRFLAFRRATKELLPLFSTQPGLGDFAIAQRAPHLVAARDGLELPVHLYLPAGTNTNEAGYPVEPLPTVIYVHGGPMICNPWDMWFTNRNFQLLTNRGYAVLNVDFRGAGGYGKEFQRKGWGEWGGEMQRDFVDIAHWAVAQGIAPQDKIAMWGWSYGGLSS